jgi:putative nucleotidyltransferase with HDIG domain
MNRILFVDDEPAVLDALRDRLRKQRKEWEMVFARGGDEALAHCEAGAFDVIVSDMRMPGMDGAELLRRVRDRWPTSIRLVLSGHAEREAVIRALPVAHQYVSKPCDTETLRSTIARACTLRDLLADDTLRKIVGGIDKLPSVSSIYLELAATLADDNASITDVVRIVERDPAMCLKLLQIVNSAYFGLARRVTAMRDAISYLGVNLVKALALAADVFARAEAARGVSPAFLGEVQQHSMRVARLARAIAPTDKDDAFMAGMLHDVGRLVVALADQASPPVAAQDRPARQGDAPVHEAERARFGVSHAEVGAYVLGSWGVPLLIVEAVAGHHDPQRMSTTFDTVTVLHVADALVSGLDGDRSERASIDEAHLGRLGLLEKVAVWRDRAAESCEEQRA